MDRPLLVGLGLDRVLADAVDRGQVAALHRVEHPRQVPAALRRDRDAPLGVELGPQLVVLDVLEARQPVGQGAHVAAALDVVLAAQRVDAAAVAADVAGQQDEVIRARTLSTALWCSVMPSVQQIIARGAVAKAWASSRMASAGTPVSRSAYSSVYDSTLAL